MQIGDRHITGWCDQCWEYFNRSIGQYKRYYKYAKIGITIDYKERASNMNIGRKNTNGSE